MNTFKRITCKITSSALIMAAVGASSSAWAETSLNMKSECKKINGVTQCEWVGQGLQYKYTLSNSTITPGFNYQDLGNGVQFRVQGSAGPRDDFTLSFDSKSNGRLTPGIYRGAMRFPFNQTNNPPLSGLSVSGQGRGCNELSGEFTIFNIRYQGACTGVSDCSIRSFGADFVQYCENLPLALRGTILFNTRRPINNPEPRPLPILQ